jgi:hypothetical protein
VSAGCCEQVTLVQEILQANPSPFPSDEPTGPVRNGVRCRFCCWEPAGCCMHSLFCVLIIWMPWSRPAAPASQFSQSFVIACNELSVRCWECTGLPPMSSMSSSRNGDSSVLPHTSRVASGEWRDITAWLWKIKGETEKREELSPNTVHIFSKCVLCYWEYSMVLTRMSSSTMGL